MGAVAEIALPIALAFIMFSLGLGLTFADFARVAANPRDFLTGLCAQMLLLPAVALLLIALWPMAPELALGIMIIAAAPGGVTSNILTAFARGDVALSISMTAVTSLLCVISIPLIVTFSYGYLFGAETDNPVSVASTAISVFVIVTVPVLIGLAFRRFAERQASAFEPVANRISTVLFLVVFAGAILQERSNIIPYFAQAGLATLALNVIMMVLAYILAKVVSSGGPQRIAISIECGLQNGTLAIAVATLLFGGGLAIIPAATYSLIMFGTALIYIAVLRRSAA